MDIAFTGYHGFLASSMRERWRHEGYRFYALERNANDEQWREILTKANVVVNLAGSPVLQRWSKKGKQRIFQSRVQTTARLVRLINEMQALHLSAPTLLISASAIGVYPDDGAEISDEYSQRTGGSFLSSVVLNWEDQAMQLTHPGVRLVIARIGIVLSSKAGLVKKILPIFKLGLGGKVASGKQKMSFVHIDDLVRAFHFFISNTQAKGTFNIVATEVATNEVFTRCISRLLNVPAILPVPAFALRMVFGDAASIMVNGENVYPTRLLKHGFTFRFPLIEDAVKDILVNKS